MIKVAFSKCEEKECNERILYLVDQVIIPRYCKEHLKKYAHVYFKKNLKPINK